MSSSSPSAPSPLPSGVGSPGKGGRDVNPAGVILSRISSAIESLARGLLVNIPMYLLSIDELDNAATMSMAYLLLQVVGFCWAFLVNAAFALAVRSTELLLPPAISAQNSAEEDNPPHKSSFGSLQLISAFYVSYASIRVVIGYAQSVFNISLESVKSFPHAAKQLSRGGKRTLHLTQLVFIPPFVMQLSLIFADYACKSPSEEMWRVATCRYFGISYLVSSTHPDLRRLVIYSILLIVIQLWQASLQQFPNWQDAFKSLKRATRLLFQLVVLVLSLVSTVTASFILFLPNSFSYLSQASLVEETVCVVLMGWTLWLFFFIPVLVTVQGDKWERDTKRVWEASSPLPLFTPTPRPLTRELSKSSLGSRASEGSIFDLVDMADLTDSTELPSASVPTSTNHITTEDPVSALGGNDLRVFAGFMRLSHMLLLMLIFFAVCFHRGYPEAQLLLTFLTIVVPALYCLTYLLCVLIIKAGPPLVILGVPFAFLFAYGVTKLAESAGNGSIILVFVHAVIKGAQFFADEEEDEEDEDEEIVSMRKPRKSPLSQKKDTNDNLKPIVDPPDSSSSSSSSSLTQRATSNSGSTNIQSASASATNEHSEREAFPSRRPSSNTSLGGCATGPAEMCLRQANNSIQDSISRHCSSSGALYLLEERGTKHSSLVSIIPKTVKEHWLVALSKRNMTFVFSLARKVAVSDSLLSGMIRLFSAVSIIIALILATISLASYVQQRLEIFPRLIDFKHDVTSNTVLFDHRISNITLHLSPSLVSNEALGLSDMAANKTSCENLISPPPPPLPLPLPLLPSASTQKFGLHPHYALCSWRFRDALSLLDFSLMSELAYFDGNSNDGSSLQEKVDMLFPRSLGFDFVVKSSPRVVSGPMYLEFHSASLNLTVVAIRGTDVGRLRDFMEDVNLYAEPVVYSMLSAVFPTIRWWTHDTTSRIIAWLFEFNSFFGLQAEAEYYRSLTERVFEISNSTAGGGVIITGHSLGGGLARIVGTLTGLPSVSFSPPGLKLSYRKYSVRRPDGSIVKVPSTGGALHHQSIAIVTELDWITQVDVQPGLVQQILCDNNDKAHQNACHLLEGTICHLLQHCGDSRQRFQEPFCESTYNIGAVFPSLLAFFTQHRIILFPSILLALLMILLAVVPEIM